MDVSSLTNLLFIPVILFLGAITTYEDMTSGRIRNKWIIFSLLYSFLVNLLFYLFLLYNGFNPRTSYLGELFGSIILSLLLGYLFWNLGVWTAGDAKLFAAYTALLPLNIFSYGNLKIFSFLIILINTVVPFFIFYSIKILLRTRKKHIKYFFNNVMKIQNLAGLFLFLFGVSWPIQVFFSAMGIRNSFFLEIIFLFLFLILFERYLSIRFFWVSMGLSVLRLIIDKSIIYPQTFYYLFFLFSIFVVVRFFMLTISYGVLTNNVDVDLLKPGMVPAETIISKNGQISKKPIISYSFLEIIMGNTNSVENIVKSRPEGLTKKEIKSINQKAKKEGFDHIKVFDTMPFAPFLLSGVLLTLLFQGNIFIALMIAFHFV